MELNGILQGTYMLPDKLVQVDTSQGKRTVRVGIVGGGKGCYELLKLFHYCST